MVNCYNILGIPDYSDSHTAKKAYRQLAKKLHPDTNTPTAHEEQFGVVAKAYATLSDPELKRWYDKKLRAYHQGLHVVPDHTKVDPRRPRFTPEEWEEFQAKVREREWKNIQAKNRKFAYWKRSVLSFLIVLTGAQLLYTNWFIDLNTNMRLYIILGVLLFLLGCVQLVKAMFLWGKFWNMKKGIAKKYEPLSIGIFLVILLCTPLGIWGLNEYRKSYHLSHYGVIETGEIIDLDGNGAITFEYRDKAGKAYRKAMPFDPRSIHNEKQKWIVVRYSQADPRIAELVIRKNPKIIYKY